MKKIIKKIAVISFAMFTICGCSVVSASANIKTTTIVDDSYEFDGKTGTIEFNLDENGICYESVIKFDDATVNCETFVKAEESTRAVGDYVIKNNIDVPILECLRMNYLGSEMIIEYVSYTEEQATKVRNYVKELVKEHVGKDKYETLHNINNYIVKNFEYDYSGTVFTPYEVIDTKYGVCMAYSALLSYICDELNIDEVQKFGQIKGNKYGHIFNLLNIEGVWRVLDLTWNLSLKKNSDYLISLEEYQEKSGYQIYTLSPDEYKNYSEADIERVSGYLYEGYTKQISINTEKQKGTAIKNVTKTKNIVTPNEDKVPVYKFQKVKGAKKYFIYKKVNKKWKLIKTIKKAKSIKLSFKKNTKIKIQVTKKNNQIAKYSPIIIRNAVIKFVK